MMLESATTGAAAGAEQDQFAQVLQMLEPLKAMQRRNIHSDTRRQIDAIFQELHALQESESSPTLDASASAVEPVVSTVSSLVVPSTTTPSSGAPSMTALAETSLLPGTLAGEAVTASASLPVLAETSLLPGTSAAGEDVTASGAADVEEREGTLVSNGSRSSPQSQHGGVMVDQAAELVPCGRVEPRDALSGTVDDSQAAQVSNVQAQDSAEGQSRSHDPPSQAPSASASSSSAAAPASGQSEISARFAEYMARVEARRTAALTRRQERVVQLNAALDQIAAGMGLSAGDTSHLSEADIDANTTTFTWNGAEDTTCTICIEDLAPGAEVRRLRCGHVYHRECVDAWLSRSRLCCLCKQAIDSSA